MFGFDASEPPRTDVTNGSGVSPKMATMENAFMGQQVLLPLQFDGILGGSITLLRLLMAINGY